jgi:hypothetical protein
MTMSARRKFAVAFVVGTMLVMSSHVGFARGANSGGGSHGQSTLTVARHSSTTKQRLPVRKEHEKDRLKHAGEVFKE